MNKIINKILESFDIILEENKSSLLEISSSEFRTNLKSLGHSEKNSELTSGGDLNSNFLDILTKLLEEWEKTNPNCNLKFTSGNDKFHKGITSYTSRHTKGEAVDVTLDQSCRGTFISLLNNYKSKYNGFSFIDEYTRPTAKATGGHFHISYRSGAPEGSGKSGGNITPKEIDPIISTNKSSSTKQPETTQPETTQYGTTQPDDDDDQFGINDIDKKDPLNLLLTKAASLFGLKEEKIYSELGNGVSVKDRSIILPKKDNNKIKSPTNGVINNYHSNRYCVNQLTIEHNIENKKYYLEFCNISDPQVRDGRKVSKGDILGNTSTDVTVSLFDNIWNQIYLSKMLNKEISKDIISKKKRDNNKGDEEKDDIEKEKYIKKTEYYDPIYPWLGKKIFDIGKKIQDKMPSMTKGGEPKTKNFFKKYGMTNKKVNENIERIKTLLK